MSEHTPGPWYVNCFGGQYQIRRWPMNPKKPSLGMLIAEPPEVMDPNQQQPNAHLMAASPDLLEAAQEARAFAKSTMVATRAPEDEDWDARRQEAGRILESLNKAIAKAEGSDA